MPQLVVLTPEEMREMVDRHIAAESAKDVAGAIAVYADDVEHDIVGVPGAPFHGPEAASHVYEMLSHNLDFRGIRTNHEYFGEDFYVVEHQWTGNVVGEFLGVPGHGKPVDFRMLHVFEFREGKISRENVWLDSGAIMDQLSGP